MNNQIEIIKSIADEIINTHGMLSDKEFYTEFNSRASNKFGIKTECIWKHVDVGMYGCNDYVYQTSCNTEFDTDKTRKTKFCPNCGNKVV